jgi:guanosine-3',5'-bis(diphosphate) 3'-pyrophosphohydrolase
MTSAFDAMMFARSVHADQFRKYTGNPYADHLAEVAGIAATVAGTHPEVDSQHILAVCWLHDCVEDQGVQIYDLEIRFGPTVAKGIFALSDIEMGNRTERKRLSRVRLGTAPGWVQTVKCADIISNAGSIKQYDPKFAAVFFGEARALLAVMTKANRHLHALACTAASPELR